MKLTLVLPTEQILSEVNNHSLKRRDIAQTYRLAMEAEKEGEKVDWYLVNTAIVKRWSRSGLEYIKRTAWNGSCFLKWVEK